MSTSLPRTAAPTTYPVAELERRFTAFAVDRLLGWALLAAIGVATWFATDHDLTTTAAAVAGAAALLWLVLAVVLGTTGSSPGKSLTGLRVVHHGTGTPIGVARALLRSLVLAVSGLPTFGIGVATLAWTALEDAGRQRRGWHDHVGHSVVVDVRPVPEAEEVEQDAGPRHIVNLTAMRLVPAPPVEAPRTPARTHTSDQSVRRQALLPDLAPPVQVPPVQVPPVQAPPAQAPPAQAPLRTGPPQQAPVPQHRPVPQHVPAARHDRPAPPVQHVPLPPTAASYESPPPSHAPAPPAPTAHPPSHPPSHRHAAPRHAAQPRWRVHFDHGESFVIAGLALVGRRPEPRAGEAVAHLVPLASQDMSVSKTHAQLGPASDGTIVVMDRGSTNGTVLVRKGVSRPLTPGRPATLLDGDKVVFGDREMVLTREA